MNKDDLAFPIQMFSYTACGLSKFEYMCIEFMKSSIIANNNMSPGNRSKENIVEHAQDSIRMARALCNELRNEKGR